MRRVITIVGAVLTSLLTCQSFIARSPHRQTAPPRQHVEDLKKRPDLGVDYSQVANLKLASRKTSYRVGEMISIDIAIINSSDAPVFFHKLE